MHMHEMQGVGYVQLALSWFGKGCHKYMQHLEATLWFTFTSFPDPTFHEKKGLVNSG